MKKLPELHWSAVLILVSALFFSACDNTETSVGQTPVQVDGLSASSSALVLLVGSDGKSVISGGTEPYSVTEVADPSVVSAQISSREVRISALAIGNASIKVKDASSPAKTVTVNVTVKTAYSAGTAGSLSFSSNRGNFSVNGVAEFGIFAPVSGSGAIAMQNFESLFIFSYTVNTPTDLDLVLIGFESPTSDYSGTFYYPASGKIVYVSYYPHIDPNDTTFLDSGFLLNASATAVMESISSNSMKGTFSGNGYYFSNGAYNPSVGISVTNGKFTVPIVRTGLMTDRSMKKNISRAMKKIAERTTRF